MSGKEEYSLSQFAAAVHGLAHSPRLYRLVGSVGLIPLSATKRWRLSLSIRDARRGTRRGHRRDGFGRGLGRGLRFGA